MRNRSATAASGPSTRTSAPLAAAAPSVPSSIRRRGGTTSARLNPAEMTAPATKPNCTAMMSSEAAPVDRPQSSRSWGITADAENHGAIESIMARARTASAR